MFTFCIDTTFHCLTRFERIQYGFILQPLLSFRSGITFGLATLVSIFFIVFIYLQPFLCIKLYSVQCIIFDFVSCRINPSPDDRVA